MSSSGSSLAFLLDDLVAKLPGVGSALLVAADGLKTAASQGVSLDEGDQLAAIASGLFSLARNTDGGGVRQVVVEAETHTVFVSACGDHTRLVVVAAHSADVGDVAHEMAQLVKAVRSRTSTPRRVTTPTGVDATAGNGARRWQAFTT